MTKLEQQFELFRKAYPNTKRGFEPELKNFKYRHKNWKEVIPLLMPALIYQTQIRERYARAKEFIPLWKNLQTWINQSGWTLEYPEPPESSEDRDRRIRNSRRKSDSERKIETAVEDYKCFKDWSLEQVRAYVKKRPTEAAIAAAKHYRPELFEEIAK